MLFSRPSNDTTNESYYSLVRKPPFITTALTLSVTASTLLYMVPGGARPTSSQQNASSPKTTKVTEQKLSGAWGWTTGTQTYLRVRPSTAVPAVAKVARQTKLFVWGTYNGWYRVETPDHVFGWVYHDYLNVPNKGQLQELSQSKAKAASDRDGHQTMYGSTDLLLRHYAQYGAPGARRGLMKQGVKLADAPKPKSTVKTVSTTVKPKAAPKPVQAAKPKAKKPTASSIALKQRQLRIQQERERLRRRMGTPVMAAPPQSSPGVPPITPEELMKAREAFLNARNGTNALTNQPKPPASTTRGNNGSSGENSATVRPSSFTASRSKTPQGKAPLSRGGSPRDYVKHAAKSSSFNKGLVDQALGYRGMPYIRGAQSPSRGFDCSGLVYFLLRQRGYNPPRTAAGYARYGQAVPKGKLQSGDILLFANTYKRGISHMGIYIGNGRFVHAARTGLGVRTDSLTSGYYAKKYYGARRVPPK